MSNRDNYSQSQTPQIHINPNFTGHSKSDQLPKVHINPNFSGQGPSSKVLLNPNFKTRTKELTETVPSVHVNPNFKQNATETSTSSKLHVNPRFANRPLPSVPTPSSSKPVKPQRSSVRTSQTQLQTENIYANIHVNPSFSGAIAIDKRKKAEFEEAIKNTVQSSQSTMLVNPNFRKQEAPLKPKRHSIHVNPEFSIRVNPEQIVGENATPVTSKIQEEKENLPSTKTKHNLFTPVLMKTPFRKIGTKKLIRTKRKSNSSSFSATPSMSTSFKKIGTKKLIRVRGSNLKENEQPSGSGRAYKVKTTTKIVKSSGGKKTPVSKSRFSFVTPLSIRKSRFTFRKNSIGSCGKPSSVGKSSQKKKIDFKSRFRLDRRPPKEEKKPAKRKVVEKCGSQTRLKKISGSLYHVSPTCIKKSVPAKPTRATTSVYRQKNSAVNPRIADKKVITVQGVKFAVADNGRKLRRVTDSNQLSTAPATTPYTSPATGQPSPANSNASQPSPGDKKLDRTTSRPSLPSSSPPAAPSTSRKVYLGGEEFDEIEPGVFTRSRHSLTRQSLTHAKQRSINIILKSQNRSKQYCMFYNKFGKCTKRDKGSCPFIHDKEKIAVCRRFLKGACVKEDCLLSHKVAPEKMPTCKFFLEGVCTADNCPYLHVKVNSEAAICQQFLKGYCPNGTDCKQRHVIACPDFDKTGLCRKGEKCPFPHVGKNDLPKKKPPAKPKRKSLGQTSDHTLQKKSRVATRYYQDNIESRDKVVEDDNTGENLNNIPDEQVNEAIEELKVVEAKRKRLLRKIELAKQGWTRPDNMDDSGPYEKIDNDDSSEDEVTVRTPIGQLGDFISLAGYSSEEGENCDDDRLI